MHASRKALSHVDDSKHATHAGISSGVAMPRVSLSTQISTHSGPPPSPYPHSSMRAQIRSHGLAAHPPITITSSPAKVRMGEV